MVGFLGPNGAGKTTTLKMLSGILYPTSGAISVLDFTPQDRKAVFQKQIALVMGQKNQLWWDLPATDTFTLQKDIYKVPTDQYNKTLNELVELLDVKDILLTQVRRLSLGERMKCELIAALLHRPKVLFLDEPTIGLDIVVQKKIRSFFKEYNKRFKTTIILTSHYMDDVKEICDRVIMIDHGHKIYDGKINQLVAEYANEKYIEVEFDEDVQRESLEKIGNVVEYEFLKAVISVPREGHTKKAAEILEKFPVVNLDIQDVELEDIIMKYFVTKHA
jgi:ABC-2 type transport system ATP-binding protein